MNTRANGGYSSRPKKERKVTYVLRKATENQHCSGINSVTVTSDGSTLYTASRDSTVKRWGLHGSPPTFEASFEGHADWVNDLTLIENTLITCSSDSTVKAWRSNTGECLRTYPKHSDYVMALASAPSVSMFASGGLGGEVLLWDLNSAMGPIVRNYPDESSYTPMALRGHKESVYSVAMNPTATTLVTGSTENSLRVWDPRTGQKSFKLKGHTGNVKALLLNSSGRMCLSGSSDNTIRLWDLGQQRCVQTFAVHTDSIWALAADPSFSHVYSGGRDCNCYVTDLHNRESILLFTESHPIVKLALDASQAGTPGIWAATPTSSIHKWSASKQAPPGSIQVSRKFVAGSSPFARARVSLDVSAPAPAQAAPQASIPGSPGIVQHAVMNNRVHVLTKDSSEEVALWDITRGEVIEAYGRGVSFDDKLKELEDQVSMPAWFTLDTRLGSISVTLEPPGCFTAEMYAVDLGVTGASDELKVNLGEQVLRMVFSQWLEKRNAREGVGDRAGSGSASGGSTPGLGRSGSGEEDDALLAEPVFTLPSPVPAIISEYSSGVMWRMLPTEYQGTEGEDTIPPWVVDCMLFRRLPPQRESTKCSFFLNPLEGSQQSLSPGKLSAPRILRVHKVVNYVVQRLNIATDKSAGPPSTSKNPRNSEHGIQILCNDQALPLHMSLASVRQYIWKKSDDLELFYRRI